MLRISCGKRLVYPTDSKAICRMVCQVATQDPAQGYDRLHVSCRLWLITAYKPTCPFLVLILSHVTVIANAASFEEEGGNINRMIDSTLWDAADTARYSLYLIHWYKLKY